MAYGKIKADAIIRDTGSGDEEITMATIVGLDTNKAPKASPTFTGTVTLPATTALAGQASDVTIIDNNAAALEVKEGSTAYVTFDTTNSSEQIEVAKKVQLAEDLEFSAAKDILIPDNQAAGLEIKEGTNAYVTFDTTDSSEQIEVAKAVVTSDNITLNAQKEVRWADSDSSNYIAFASPATVSTNSTWTLPSDAPTAGDVLSVSSVSSNNPTLEWAPAEGGKILQVKQTLKTDTFSATASSHADLTAVTGLSVSITPTATSSKILVRCSVMNGNGANTTFTYWNLARGSTMIAQGDSAGSRSRVGFYNSIQANYDAEHLSMEVLDSPNTTGEVTYNVYASAQNGQVVYVNRSGNDSNSSHYGRGWSTITVMEVAA